MKPLTLLAVALLSAGLALRPAPVQAQTVVPPTPSQQSTAVPTGKVSGKVVDQNKGSAVTESQEVMLHIWDEQNNEINMLHAQSASDGSFLFTGVNLQPQYVYGTMAVFDGVTYLSQVVPPKEGSNQLDLDVPVYETTQDASAIQIRQMHVLFEFAPDGLQTTEIFALSNTGIRTVKDAVKLDDGKTATLRYPLPQDADYIFFQPDTSDRFVRFTGGFADTSPLMPGGEGDRFAVQYMVPYSGSRSFDYKAPANIQAFNFLLPQNSGVQLKGDGLQGPQPVTLDAGKSYEVYALSDLRAGQTVHVTLTGKPSTKSSGAASTTGNLNLPLALGGGFLGFAMIGAGFWWWRRPQPDSEAEVELGTDPGDATLDDLIVRIAQLDHAHEQGEVDDEQYRRERAQLREEAKDLMRVQERS